MNEVLMGDEVYSAIYKQELQKTIEHSLRVEKILNMKKDRVLVKWKCFFGRLETGLIKPTYLSFLE